MKDTKYNLYIKLSIPFITCIFKDSVYKIRLIVMLTQYMSVCFPQFLLNRKTNIIVTECYTQICDASLLYPNDTFKIQRINYTPSDTSNVVVKMKLPSLFPLFKSDFTIARIGCY